MQRAKAFFYASLGLLALALVWHFGAVSARSQTTSGPLSDVAILTGIVSHDEVIPLPTYSDGTLAQESECYWMVSPSEAYDGVSGYGTNYCLTQRRRVLVYNSCCPVSGKANYMIVAVRREQPVESTETTWGRVKAERR